MNGCVNKGDFAVEERLVWRRGEGAWRFDLLDAGDVARLGAAIDGLGEAVRDGEAGIVAVCGRLRDFLDGVLGDGAGRVALPEEHLGAAMACYADFLAFVKAQAEGAEETVRVLMAEYGVGDLDTMPPNSGLNLG